MKSVSYENVVKRKQHPKGSDLARFSKLLNKQLQEEYESTFGLGELLATRRLELEMSQLELSEESGIPQADISRIECGRANPTLKTVEKLLGALNLRMTVSRQ